jgi:hypothetical protein
VGEMSASMGMHEAKPNSGSPQMNMVFIVVPTCKLCSDVLREDNDTYAYAPYGVWHVL